MCAQLPALSLAKPVVVNAVTTSNNEFKDLMKNAEFRFYLFSVFASTAVVMLALIFKNGYGIEHAFRNSLFEVVTALTPEKSRRM